MLRRPDTLETVHLTLAMLARASALPRKITARQLHDALAAAGVARDVRTVQRQLRMLVEPFDTVCDDRSRPCGYSWKKFARGFVAPAIEASAFETISKTFIDQHAG